ncbi:MAG: MBL fold metallo-hydrolase, partial [Muribaculaceae bacterium]|nr:MBL fold metallo-hydrolase [Muribaculaceae bacterium]
IDPDRIKSELKINGIDYKGIQGIILTHDHSDHVRFAYQLLRKQKRMMLYTTPRTLSGLLRRHSISSRIKDYHKPIYKEHPFEIGLFRITPFDTSHDGTDNVGFHISYGEYHSFVVMTDSGCITDRSDFYIRQARYLMIESNYDAHMLAEGSYPEFLKARIASDRGHMDNRITAEYLAKAYSPTLTHIFLCHLSHDNNTPELALAESRKALENAGISVGDASGSIEARKAQVQLYALPRFDSSTLFVFRESNQI